MKHWSVTHGKSSTSEYKAWNNMLSRCNNPNHPRYKDWGGRGITVDSSWFKFENFYKDMGERPSSKHTLERKDNAEGYSKGNCYWATTKEQSANRRSNTLIYYDEASFIPRDWAEKFDINKTTFTSRLSRGWTMPEIIEGKRTTTPRIWRTLAKHKEGKHSRKCEQYIERNTYRCRFTEEVFKKGVEHGRPYR